MLIQQSNRKKVIVLTPQVEKKAWTPDLVLRRLLERYRAGLPMRSKDVDIADKNLRLTTIRLFGSWTAGLEAAGLYRLPSGRVYSLVDLLRHRAENCQPTTLIALRREGKFGRKLYREAVTKFGGWKGALKQAGIMNTADIVFLEKGP